MQRVFTDEQELGLLEYYRNQNFELTHRELARMHGVDQSTITRALARAEARAIRAKRSAKKAKP